MRRDFEITQGIYLVQPPHELDLHNVFDFLGLEYEVLPKIRTSGLNRKRTGNEAAETKQTDPPEILGRV